MRSIRDQNVNLDLHIFLAQAIYPFMGCYKDMDADRDMEDGTSVDYNSHYYCANRCKEKGYKYFGVQVI